MSDRRIRALQRRFESGDHTVVPELFHALTQAGLQTAARNVVLRDMLATGEWVQWPQWTPLRRWREAISELNFDLEAFMSGEPIVTPGVNLDVQDEDGEVGTEYFTDGPYLVQYAEDQDPYLVQRQYGGAPPGERGFIPIWQVELLAPWRGIRQEAHAHVRETDPAHSFWVDAPVIQEQGVGRVVKDVDGYLQLGTIQWVRTASDEV